MSKDKFSGARDSYKNFQATVKVGDFLNDLFRIACHLFICKMENIVETYGQVLIIFVRHFAQDRTILTRQLQIVRVSVWPFFILGDTISSCILCGTVQKTLKNAKYRTPEMCLIAFRFSLIFPFILVIFWRSFGVHKIRDTCLQYSIYGADLYAHTSDCLLALLFILASNVTQRRFVFTASSCCMNLSIVVRLVLNCCMQCCTTDPAGFKIKENCSTLWRYPSSFKRMRARCLPIRATLGLRALRDA